MEIILASELGLCFQSLDQNKPISCRGTDGSYYCKFSWIFFSIPIVKLDMLADPAPNFVEKVEKLGKKVDKE